MKCLRHHVTDAGGYESYPQVTRASNWDSDHDGLPDWWETIKGLSTNSPSGNFADANADTDGDGFTNLDDYINWMAGPHYFTTNGSAINIALSALSKGYTSSPSYSVANAVNGMVTLSAGIAQFTPAATGLCSFTFTVTDSEGASMTRKVNIARSNTIVSPLTILSLAVNRCSSKDVLLKWKTDGEVDADHFEVQRRFGETGDFVNTGAFVRSKAMNGNSAATLEYEILDTNSFKGNTYYRVVLKDVQAKAVPSDIKIAKGVAPDFSAWPVPNNGQFWVMASNVRQPMQLQVFDLAGKLISTQAISGDAMETVRIVRPGAYLLKVVDAVKKQVLFTKKVLVQ